MSRSIFLGELRRAAREYGLDNIVYFDESAFAATCHRRHGWAPKGQKIFAEVQGKRAKKTTLIMGQRRGKYLAPLLFQGCSEALTIEHWVENCLMPELKSPSVIVMDNAPVHRKKRIEEILSRDGHILLPLPPYSPDLSEIEPSFGTLKKRREFLPEGTELDVLFKDSSLYE